MDSFFPTDGAPSSPWARRFPARNYTFTFQKENHSVLAPIFPTIENPKYYDQNPTRHPDHRPQTLADEDRVFFTEQHQNFALYGITTWQASALNHYARFSPNIIVSGGYRPLDRATGGFPFRIPSSLPAAPSLGLELAAKGIQTNEEMNFAVYLRERIEIDETRWLPFLRKDNWFDWTEVTQTFDSAAGKTWSVDEPKLWENLRVSLELVNRFLEALIEDRHEGAYWSEYEDVFGTPPEPNDSVLLTYEMEKRISKHRGVPCPSDYIPKIPSSEWRERLVDLLGRVILGFCDAAEVEGSTYNLVLVDQNRKHYHAAVTLATHRIGFLIGSDLTLGELCLAQVDLALTLMHEIMHAILGVRYKDDDYIGNNLNLERSGPTAQEPFLDAEGIAETGHYMDQLFFGGSEFLFPAASSASMPPISMGIREFPWRSYGGRAVADSAFLQPDALDVIHHVPLTWASQLLSESFWRDPDFARKSENFFHRNDILVSATPAAATEYYEPEVNLGDREHFYLDDEDVADNFELRCDLWNNIRGEWYIEAKIEWQASPWRFIRGRKWCDEFALAFERKDLIMCANIAHNLLYSETKPYWAWHAIGGTPNASVDTSRSHVPIARDTTNWCMDERTNTK
ncbi:hypothetical protein GQX73_g9511 [Xylaria multiplex]|uniref:Uncharacterized protein n=1 Tax=Xylaria multiplex TaxID=323545 RepID=A0A7C8II57_9PEZI|nr:hypothetical protein GQX73_g9511 [Xylaria multiplex]